jgi:hypothetical protein
MSRVAFSLRQPLDSVSGPSFKSQLASGARFHPQLILVRSTNMLCKCCSLIDFQLIFNYGEDIRDGYPHHASLTKLIKSASAGCDLCSLFLKAAEDYAQDSFESIEACG